ncbi:hypothetical protein [Pseudomonas cichorii]|uniref:hypothetical protein n=1 Tax=Pseudomonas cichorii TaxID=36746 RepID=UPI000EFE8A16|nr:hypothetical protein [Pseudomonas cichorii]
MLTYRNLCLLCLPLLSGCQYLPHSSFFKAPENEPNPGIGERSITSGERWHPLLLIFNEASLIPIVLTGFSNHPELAATVDAEPYHG